MLDFLKRFGLGIFYTVISPFLAAFFIGWFLYTFVIFFIELIKSIISFFKGKNFFPIIKEDKEAKIILSTLEDQVKLNEHNDITNNQTNQTININLAPGVNPSDVISKINNSLNENKKEINNTTQKINLEEKKEIELDTTNNNQNNGGNI